MATHSGKTKSKRKNLTLQDKIRVIEMREKGYSLNRVANEFSIGKSTVFDIVKQKHKLKDFIAERQREDCSSRKKMRKSDDNSLDKAVYLWFIQERSKGTPISGPLIMEKARMLHKAIHPDAIEDVFKASEGWLHRFKQRHGIRELRLQGESLSADIPSIEPYKEKTRDYIEEHQLSLNQIFNADETGLYWRLLPEKTLAGGYEKTAKNFKKPKDRVTILAAANASGDFRLPLLLIGKSKKPRCFKHVNVNNLPVLYASQKKAWMDSSLFLSWFFDTFVPSVEAYLKSKGLSKKAVLFLDNAPTHPSSEILKTPDGSIKCIFLPANTTSVLQPMDQGVLENLKRRYKRALLEKLLLALEDGTPQQFVKDLNIKDCIYMIAKAWNDIREQSLARSFNKLLLPSGPPPEDPTQDAQDVVDVGSAELALSAIEVEEWLNSDRNITEELTTEEIIELVDGQSDVDTSDDETEDLHPSIITHKAAVDSFDVCIQYLEQQPDTSTVQLMLLNQLKSAAATKSCNSAKQMHITDFFTQNQN